VLYEYPSLAGYGSGTRASEGIDNDAVERQSKLRMMSSEADHQRSEGASTVRTLAPGRRFKPYDVANPTNIFDEQVITEITHTAHDRSYATNEEGDPEYQNTFTAIPSKVPATPHRLTPRPKIDGTQVALVAGPDGEEIHPDEYGRIKVWFPWDRRAKKNGSDTCWVRVMQNWAGAGWGGQVIPRIGMEVMVMYLDGDPDRPVVTGVVPYTLPANKTKSIFRTNTHKGQGFNELNFEDEKGRQEIYMHAQRDNRIHVENSRSKRIDNNQSESIGRNKNIEVGNNHDEVIGGNMTLMVGPNILQKGVTAAMQVLRSKARDLMTDNLGKFTDLLGFMSPEGMGEGNLVIGVGKNKAAPLSCGPSVDTRLRGVNMRRPGRQAKSMVEQSYEH
jgi:type VI secretion system secreted protein VgrG